MSWFCGRAAAGFWEEVTVEGESGICGEEILRCYCCVNGESRQSWGGGPERSPGFGYCGAEKKRSFQSKICLYQLLAGVDVLMKRRH